MKKIVLLFFLVVIIVFFIFKANDYRNANKCSSSEYVANGERVWIRLDPYFKNLSLKEIKIKTSNNNEYDYKIDTANNLNFYIDSKILVEDTLTILLKDKIYKVYDFKNGGQMSNAGQDKGNFHCGILNAVINGKVYNLYGYNEIFLGKDF
ncbi:hypothetical protein [Flavobacterium ginsengiterrae]|uniref:Uncharacterized protein n=1 Tax=Flavobacterium ginsengiterrae TaxID=871695 RepID=A0ABP7GMJ9_9FLAO